jgi:hypothetical protein
MNLRPASWLAAALSFFRRAALHVPVGFRALLHRVALRAAVAPMCGGLAERHLGLR